MPTRYQDLPLYKRAQQLCDRVWAVVENFPEDVSTPLGVKMQKASRSVAACIAEGYTQRERRQEMERHLTDAITCCQELRRCFTQGRKHGYLSVDEHEELDRSYAPLEDALEECLSCFCFEKEDFSGNSGSPTARATMSVGLGWDIHRLVPGRKLVLGGVEIPGEKGLTGHSDADVLCHAIGDALLGAAGAGDLGHHFPDTDPQWAGISSLELLKRIVGILGAQRRIHHIDTVVICEAPRLAPHVPAMREKIGTALGIDPSEISVKAKTSEGLGEVGKGEGIAAYAVALIETTV